MSSKSKKLGSLADIYQSEHLDGTITKIRLDRIHPSTEQPRQDRTAGVDELAASIRQDGLLSPLVVTRDGQGYRIIAGERRYHALKQLGKSEAECRIISREERDYWRISIIENLQREDLSAPEEAAALLRLKQQENYSDADLAGVLGKSRNYITEILGIAAMPDEAVRACAEAGVTSKNLMIQAVQAFKREKLDAFLSAYRAGEIRTVRSAKDFNREGPPGEAAGRPAEKSPRKPAPEGPSLEDYRLTVRKSNLTIACPDDGAARELADWLRRRYFRS